MEYRRLFTALAIAVLSASCTKEADEADGVEVVNPNPPERRVEFLSFKASLENKYNTKTAIDLDITRKVIWEKDDEVLVEDAEGKRAVYKALTGGRDTTTLVRASGDTLNVGSTYRAWYPATYRDEGLPSEVYYDEASTFRGAPMSAEGMAKLDFVSECAVVRFAYNPASSSIVKRIAFYADQPLSRKDSVIMDITTKYPNGRTLYPTSRNEFCINMLPGEYTNVRAVLYNGRTVVADVTLEYSLNVEKGAIIDVDLNNPEGRVANLSKYGTANSYLVTHPGEFFFVPTRGCDSAPIEGIQDVVVLWETDNSTTPMATSSVENLKYEAGQVYFMVPDGYAASNVLIAARNASQEILWSWHLWITDGPVGAQKYDSEGKMMLMDRSIGTLSAYAAKASGPKYAALLFQWGRKDPIPGCTVTGTSGTRPRVAVVWRSVQEPEEDDYVSVGPVSIAETVANPYVIYKHESDWFDGSSQETLWSSDVKSMYDPCPVGYMMPPLSAFTDQSGDFYKGWAAGNLANSNGIYGGKNSFNTELYGFPLTNIIEGETGKLGKDSAVHNTWTSETSDDAALGARLYWGAPEGSSSKKVMLSAPYSYKKSDAIAVRCMLIQE